MKTILCILVILFSTIPSGMSVVMNIPIKVEEKVILDYHTVRVSMYTTNAAQTDSTPLVTASGFELDSINPGKHRIIAVSWDLKKLFKYGDKVRVEGIGKYDGVYVVRDLMHSRWEKKIDILIDPADKAISFKAAKLSKVH